MTSTTKKIITVAAVSAIASATITTAIISSKNDSNTSVDSLNATMEIATVEQINNGFVTLDINGESWSFNSNSCEYTEGEHIAVYILHDSSTHEQWVIGSGLLGEGLPELKESED